MEASEPKWVNLVLNIIGVNTLRLRDFHLAYMFTQYTIKKYTRKNRIKGFQFSYPITYVNYLFSLIVKFEWNTNNDIGKIRSWHHHYDINWCGLEFLSIKQNMYYATWKIHNLLQQQQIILMNLVINRGLQAILKQLYVS